MNRHTLKLLALLPVLAALTGCFGSAPAVPKEQYFRLIAAAPTAQSSQHITGGLEVLPFAGEGVMNERPLLFSANGGRKLEQRNYAYWTEAPPQMLRDQLVAYLRQTGVADSVSPSELRLETTYTVRGTIKRMEQLVGSSPSAAIALEIAVIEKSTDRLVLNKVYTAEKPASGSNIDDAVAALNAGLDEIFAAFAADLANAS